MGVISSDERLLRTRARPERNLVTNFVTQEGTKEEIASLQPPRADWMNWQHPNNRIFHHRMCNTDNVQLPHDLYTVL